ncbi:topoisomerase C-terminal repeat-containing protein [Novipirellula aureliae]|uniref:topoisomerase C-terminal repeat-containing protein n=1 Tax=Novipirellula aureliae TaxID=2527966 RepID=UPI0011B4174E|nr:topoisomerase C-terminal repeat-containing protein [Novipirellula aureliae]
MTSKAYRCSRWREAYPFTIGKTISGHKTSATHAKIRLCSGKTPVIKGFKSKAGKSFDARLKLVDCKACFDFGVAFESPSRLQWILRLSFASRFRSLDGKPERM